MADEREKGGTPSPQSSPGGRGGNGVPKQYAWTNLVRLDGDDLELQYSHTLEETHNGAYSTQIGSISGVHVFYRALMAATDTRNQFPHPIIVAAFPVNLAAVLALPEFIVVSPRAGHQL